MISTVCGNKYDALVHHYDDIAKWSKATVCKIVIGGFKSPYRLIKKCNIGLNPFIFIYIIVKKYV